MTMTADPTTSRPQDSPAAASTGSLVARRVLSAATTVIVALVVLVAIWALLLRVFDVSTFVGKTPLDVWNYLFSSDPPKGVRPASLTAAEARGQAFSALGTTLVDAMIGFVSGMVAATVIAVGFVLFQPFEFAFMRSPPSSKPPCWPPGDPTPGIDDRHRVDGGTARRARQNLLIPRRWGLSVRRGTMSR